MTLLMSWDWDGAKKAVLSAGEKCLSESGILLSGLCVKAPDLAVDGGRMWEGF